MTAFLTPTTWLFDSVKSEPIATINCQSTHVVGVFANHRDAKVALEELQNAGYPDRWITLFARDFQRHSWLPKLNIQDCWNEEIFDFAGNAQGFFRKLFQRRKYLILVTANGSNVNSAGMIMGRRRRYAKVWFF
ncbi:MAG: hypothetical protein ACFCU5_19285 [Pleurocapsa sp.]